MRPARRVLSILLAFAIAVLPAIGGAVSVVKVVESTDKEVWLVLPHKHSTIKFLSPYVAVSDDPEAQTGDSKSCQNPAAGCAI